jgi:hypothetical protein
VSRASPVRYEVIDTNIVRETAASQAGELVDKIIFHRVVSHDHDFVLSGIRSPEGLS